MSETEAHPPFNSCFHTLTLLSPIKKDPLLIPQSYKTKNV